MESDHVSCNVGVSFELDESVSGIKLTEDKGFDSEFLKNCTLRLICPETGAEVYLLGTAHVSKKSAQDVANAIRILKPDTIVLELCASRSAILQRIDQSEAEPSDEEDEENEEEKKNGKLKEATATRGSREFNATLDPKKAPISFSFGIRDILKILSSFKEDNRQARGNPPLNTILALFYEKIGSYIKVEPGMEFRAAYEEGIKIGAKIVLGDRPLEITLKRAWVSLSFFEKVKLIWRLMKESSSITQEDIEKLKNHDILAELVKEFSEEFPSIATCFLLERDLYMTNILRKCPGKLIVGVIGIGHLKGIEKMWKQPKIDIGPLMTIPTEKKSIFYWLTKKILIIGLVSLVTWRYSSYLYSLPRWFLKPS